MIWSHTCTTFWLLCLILDCTWYTQITPPYIPSHSTCSTFILESMVQKPNELSSTHIPVSIQNEKHNMLIYMLNIKPKSSFLLAVHLYCSFVLWIALLCVVALITAVFGKESCFDSLPFQCLSPKYSMLVRMSHIVWISIKSSS